MATTLFNRVTSDVRERVHKAAGLRLSDNVEINTTAYAEIISATGAPSGRYGCATTSLLVYLRDDATTIDSSVYILLPSETTWVPLGGESLEVANKTGGDLAKGTLVYISGYDATLACVSITAADANLPGRMATHVLPAAIANDASGVADTIALLTSYDTSAVAAAGDPMYLSATAGAWTQTAPTGCAAVQVVGIALTDHATTGSALFFPGLQMLSSSVYTRVSVPDEGIIEWGTDADVQATYANGTDLWSLTGTACGVTVATATSGTLRLNAVALLDLDAGANLDVDVTGTVDILASGTLSIDSTGASNLSATSGNLTLSTITSGNIDLTAADDINIAAAGSDVDIDSATLTVDTTGAVSIDAVGNSNLTVASGELALQTTTAGEVDITAAGLLDMNAGANLDVDITGTLDILASGTMSIDATGASNISVASGNLVLSTTTSGELNLSAADDLHISAAGSDIDMDSATLAIDCTGAMSIDAVGASNVSVTSGNLSVSTLTTGTLILDGVALIDMNAGANLDIDVTGTIDLLSTGVFSIDGTGASNVSATSGDLTLSTITSGDLILTSASGEITANDLIKLAAQAGADQDRALLLGVGTAADPSTWSAVDKSAIELRCKATGATGTSYGMYLGMEAASAAEHIPMRGRAYLTGTTGNAHGGHFTIEDDAVNGKVTGLGTGLRANWVLGNAAQEAGGTYYGALIEAYANGNASTPAAVTRYAVLGLGINGDATGAATVKNFIDFHSTGADGSGNAVYTHAHAEGNAAGSLRILVNGVAKFLKFWDAE